MNGTYYEQPFLEHFLDAIVLCEMAGDLPILAMSRHSSLARASIMAATFSIEAAANILMMPIKAPQRLIDLVDKGQVLDKYEFVLMGVQPNESLDRNTMRTQAVKELFTVRNMFVHSRSQKRAIKSRDLGEGAFTVQKQDKATNILGLPSSPEDWTVHHALRVLQATSDFLDYFVIDLCKLEDDLIRKLFLCTIETHGKSGLVLPAEQKNILHRALSKYSIDFRMARLLIGSDVLKTRSVKLFFSYTWGMKSIQLHDQKKIIEVDGDEVTSEIITNAVQHFLIWFEEAEHNPYGRRLILFEAWSEDGSERYATFRTYLTDCMKEAKSGTGIHRPIGIVPGTKAQLFFNAVLGVRRDKGELTLTVLLDTGKGRELKLNLEASMQFLQCVTLNRRNEWISEGVTDLKAEMIETKGKDYEVNEVDRIGYDPTSRTTIWTYKARSGCLMQANMKPSTLIAISELIQCAI